MLYSRTFLFIHPLYSSLHLLIPNSQSSPFPHLLSLMATTCLGRSWSWMGTPLPQLLREPLGSYQRRELKPRSCRLWMPRGWQVRTQADWCAFPSPPEPSGPLPQQLCRRHREHEPVGDLDPGRRLPEAVFLGLRSGKQQGWPGSRSVKAGAAPAINQAPCKHTFTHTKGTPTQGWRRTVFGALQSPILSKE